MPSKPNPNERKIGDAFTFTNSSSNRRKAYLDFNTSFEGYGDLTTLRNALSDNDISKITIVGFQEGFFKPKPNVENIADTDTETVDENKPKAKEAGQDTSTFATKQNIDDDGYNSDRTIIAANHSSSFFSSETLGGVVSEDEEIQLNKEFFHKLLTDKHPLGKTTEIYLPKTTEGWEENYKLIMSHLGGEDKHQVEVWCKRDQIDFVRQNRKNKGMLSVKCDYTLQGVEIFGLLTPISKSEKSESSEVDAHSGQKEPKEFLPFQVQFKFATYGTRSRSGSR